MADYLLTGNEDLVSLPAYLKGWLALTWRLPGILRAQRLIGRVGVDNRESWGSMLEETAARFKFTSRCYHFPGAHFNT